MVSRSRENDDGEIGGRPVRRSRLPGLFEFDLNWTPDENPAVSGPSIASALKEELGLKLEPRKFPSDSLTIDHVERIPTKN
jgi:uncharacterized protein (TIGR03435 family)